eukprot:365975-Chlamydomonas_euryale.AAC.4
MDNVLLATGARRTSFCVSRLRKCVNATNSPSRNTERAMLRIACVQSLEGMREQVEGHGRERRHRDVGMRGGCQMCGSIKCGWVGVSKEQDLVMYKPNKTFV